MLRKKLFFLILILASVGSIMSQDNPMRVPIAPFSTAINPGIFSAPPADTANGTWTTVANYPIAGLYGVFSYYWPDSNGIFCGGGSDAGGILHSEFYLYKIATNTYIQKASLPTTRALNKMVRVKNKLYVLSTVNNFTTPDGGTYEYDPTTNAWTTKAVMNAPIVHESGLCVYNDSLIFCIGGSTSGFGGINTVRYYNPTSNTWQTCATPMLSTIDLTQGECVGDQIVIDGGYNGAGINFMFRGKVIPGATMDVQWRNIGPATGTTSGGAPYRECTGLVGNTIVFGPAQTIGGSNANNPRMYGFQLGDSTLRRYLPDEPTGAPGVGNSHNISILTPTDSVRMYIFCGYFGAAGTNLVNRYAYKVPTSNLCEQFTGGVVPPTGWTTVFSGTLYWGYNAVSGFGLGTGSARYNMWTASSGTNQDLITLAFTPSQPGAVVNIDMAFAPYPATAPYNQDSLVILASTDGGATYTSIARLGPLQMQTAPSVSAQFTPTASQWVKRSYPLPAGTNKIDFLGKSAFGNDLFLDSICVGVPVGIGNNNNSVPGVYSLSQNYPNPFNPTTTISYGLPKAGIVKLVVYDILGREVKTLVDGFKEANTYNISFDASNLSSGIYFYSIKSGDFTQTKKMLLVK